MLTLMPECELSKSGTSFFRSAIEGLSTAASVIVDALAPPPPPAPPEHATAARAITSPRIGMARRRSEDRRFLPLMESHPFWTASSRMPPACRLPQQRCQKTTLSRYNMGAMKLQDGFEVPSMQRVTRQPVQR